MGKEYQLGTYYFPNYHIDKMNEAWHGTGWNEWALMKTATPRFPGHQQPRVPEWGYQNEADPEVMAQKIDAAAEAGLDAFIFDWYWYKEGKFLSGALEDGFLKAKNNGKLHFALMWANHLWGSGHPVSRIPEANPVLTSMGETPEELRQNFYEATEYIIETYFAHPSYWKVDGKLYFSIYDFTQLKDTFGDVAGVKAAMEDLRERVRRRGLGELHLNMVIKARPILPGEEGMNDAPDEIAAIGFDSTTSYCWLHYEPTPHFPAEPYPAYRDACISKIGELAERYGRDYIPNITVGWDPSPRTVQSDVFEETVYPFCPILVDNTPEEFQKGLVQVKQYLDEHTPKRKMCIFYAWNEWTEGGYLEPDTVYGDGYLEAIRNVFGGRAE